MRYYKPNCDTLSFLLHLLGQIVYKEEISLTNYLVTLNHSFKLLTESASWSSSDLSCQDYPLPHHMHVIPRSVMVYKNWVSRSFLDTPSIWKLLTCISQLRNVCRMRPSIWISYISNWTCNTCIYAWFQTHSDFQMLILNVRKNSFQCEYTDVLTSHINF